MQAACIWQGYTAQRGLMTPIATHADKHRVHLFNTTNADHRRNRIQHQNAKRAAGAAHRRWSRSRRARRTPCPHCRLTAAARGAPPPPARCPPSSPLRAPPAAAVRPCAHSRIRCTPATLGHGHANIARKQRQAQPATRDNLPTTDPERALTQPYVPADKAVSRHLPHMHLGARALRAAPASQHAPHQDAATQPEVKSATSVCPVPTLGLDIAMHTKHMRA